VILIINPDADKLESTNVVRINPSMHCTALVLDRPRHYPAVVQAHQAWPSSVREIATPLLVVARVSFVCCEFIV